MKKTNFVLVVLALIACVMLCSCSPKPYAGFQTTKDGNIIIAGDFIKGDGKITVPLSLYKCYEKAIGEVAAAWNEFQPTNALCDALSDLNVAIYDLDYDELIPNYIDAKEVAKVKAWAKKVPEIEQNKIVDFFTDSSNYFGDFLYTLKWQADYLAGDTWEYSGPKEVFDEYKKDIKRALAFYTVAYPSVKFATTFEETTLGAALSSSTDAVKKAAEAAKDIMNSDTYKDAMDAAKDIMNSDTYKDAMDAAKDIMNSDAYKKALDYASDYSDYYDDYDYDDYEDMYNAALDMLYSYY